MTIAIRRKEDRPRTAHGDGDVTARLLDCHGRVRKNLAEARALAGGGGSPEARSVGAAGVHRYFTEALPLHAADEDETIAPAVGPVSAPLCARLTTEHAELEGLIAILAPDWVRWRDGGTEPAGAAHRDALERFDRLMREHMEVEETELFPRIDALPIETRRQIVQAMRARRGAS